MASVCCQSPARRLLTNRCYGTLPPAWWWVMRGTHCRGCRVSPLFRLPLLLPLLSLAISPMRRWATRSYPCESIKMNRNSDRKSHNSGKTKRSWRASANISGPTSTSKELLEGYWGSFGMAKRWSSSPPAAQRPQPQKRSQRQTLIVAGGSGSTFPRFASQEGEAHV